MIIWKDIKGYEGVYQVSNAGLVKSLGNDFARKEKILKPITSKKGYLSVNLYKKNVMKKFKVHRLVAEAFVPNPYNFSQVNHKHHGGKEALLNNHSDNLEWCTDGMNHLHARF